MELRINQNDCIVFIGDSITEEYRFDDQEDGIGFGYVRLIRDILFTSFPEKNLEILNRGIGGDRVTNLAARWQEDCIELNPDIVSISVGINDVWRQLDQSNVEQVLPETFEEIYRDLIEQVQNQTSAAVVLMEPTIFQEDVDSIGNKMLQPYVEIVNKLAHEYGAILVPTHQAFLEQLHAGQRNRLTTDGVHMSSIGDMLMARTWIKTVLENF